jgi:hypothetical protein
VGHELCLNDTRADPGPAAGFNQTYFAYCNYFGMQPSAELIRYVEDLAEKNITEFGAPLSITYFSVCTCYFALQLHFFVYLK